MKVLRIEDAEGRGPYRPGFSRRWISDRDHPPAFFEELGISPDMIHLLSRKGETCRCGCVDADQLALWFDRKERRRLIKLGYRIVEVEASRIVAVTATQVVFAV